MSIEEIMNQETVRPIKREFLSILTLLNKIYLKESNGFYFHPYDLNNIVRNFERNGFFHISKKLLTDIINENPELGELKEVDPVYHTSYNSYSHSRVCQEIVIFEPTIQFHKYLSSYSTNPKSYQIELAHEITPQVVMDLITIDQLMKQNKKAGFGEIDFYSPYESIDSVSSWDFENIQSPENALNKYIMGFSPIDHPIIHNSIIAMLNEEGWLQQIHRSQLKTDIVYVIARAHNFNSSSCVDGSYYDHIPYYISVDTSVVDNTLKYFSKFDFKGIISSSLEPHKKEIQALIEEFEDLDEDDYEDYEEFDKIIEKIKSKLIAWFNSPINPSLLPDQMLEDKSEPETTEEKKELVIPRETLSKARKSHQTMVSIIDLQFDAPQNIDVLEIVFRNIEELIFQFIDDIKPDLLHPNINQSNAMYQISRSFKHHRGLKINLKIIVAKEPGKGNLQIIFNNIQVGLGELLNSILQAIPSQIEIFATPTLIKINSCLNCGTPIDGTGIVTCEHCHAKMKIPSF